MMVVFAVAVTLVHECGHYGVARLVGVEVDRVKIGLGPVLWRFHRSDTEYVVACFPIGGHVVVHTPSCTSVGQGHSDVSPKNLWAAGCVIVAGAVANILFAFAVYTGSSAVWGIEDVGTTRVYDVDVTSLPEGSYGLSRLPRGATVVDVGQESPSTWSELRRALVGASPGRLRISTSNPDSTIEVLVPTDRRDRERMADALQVWLDPVVGGVVEGSPGETAGLEYGDVITSVDGIQIASWQDMQQEIRVRPGERVELGVMRQGMQDVRVATLNAVVMQDGRRYGWLGIDPAGANTRVSLDLGRAVAHGANETVRTVSTILARSSELLVFDVQSATVKSVGSVVWNLWSGRAPIASYLRVLAVLSILIAVVSMLPLPGCDGGELVRLCLESMWGPNVADWMKWQTRVVLLLVLVWAIGNGIYWFLLK